MPRPGPQVNGPGNIRDGPVASGLMAQTFTWFTREGYSALFILGADDDAETVQDADAELHMADGTRWSATMLTTRAIDECLSRWRENGQYDGGAFFQCRDLVIVPEGGVPAMLRALNAIVQEGGPQGQLQFLDRGSEHSP